MSVGDIAITGGYGILVHLDLSKYVNDLSPVAQRGERIVSRSFSLQLFVRLRSTCKVMTRGKAGTERCFTLKHVVQLASARPTGPIELLCISLNR
jgi:hypothetical protein